MRIEVQVHAHEQIEAGDRIYLDCINVSSSTPVSVARSRSERECVCCLLDDAVTSPCHAPGEAVLEMAQASAASSWAASKSRLLHQSVQRGRAERVCVVYWFSFSNPQSSSPAHIEYARPVTGLRPGRPRHRHCFLIKFSFSLSLHLHCLRNASRSARNTAGDMPSLTTCCLHFPRTPHTSLCLPATKLPPEATLFEAIF